MRIYQISLSEAMLNVVKLAVGEIPTKHGMPILLSIQKQTMDADNVEDGGLSNGRSPDRKKTGVSRSDK